METVDAAHMRATNSSILLKLIWKNREISRADISRLTGMSRSTVSAIVADLMRRGLVNESGIGHSNGGRRPVILSFNENAYSLLGIELGASAIHAVVLNLNGHVQIKFHKECDVVNDPQATFNLLDEVIGEVQAFCENSGRPLIGAGVGVPAPLITSDAEPFLRSMFPAWSAYSLLDHLEMRLTVPIKFENDANLGALAERWWGEGHASNNLICIKVDRSVGAGLIIDGKIHQGVRGLAGEIGQMVIEGMAGQGQRQTLAASIGSRSLGAIYRALVEPERADGASSEQGDSQGDFRVLMRAAEEGEPRAIELVNRASVTLGLAVSNMLALLDSEKVIISSHCRPKLRANIIEIVRQTVREQRSFSSMPETEIVESPLGPDQVAIGAATLILDCALNDLRLFHPLQPTSLVERQWSEEASMEGRPN